MRRRTLALAVLATLVVAVGGCFNPFSPRVAPTAGVYVPPPSPTTPAGVIRLLEWCWKNRDITQYRDVFTDDYQFVFGLKDSAGNTTRDAPLTREDELNSARNLFVGGASQPPATSVTLNLDPTLNPQPDSRPGKNAKWHKEILTGVDLSIKVEGGREYRISGYARYYVVRGDSAVIPAEMKGRGFGPDSNRWYVERWNDETLGDAAATTQQGAALARALRTAGTSALPSGRSRAASPSDYTYLPVELTWGELHKLYK
jgi:hypothetical protein